MTTSAMTAREPDGNSGVVEDVLVDVVVTDVDDVVVEVVEVVEVDDVVT